MSYIYDKYYCEDCKQTLHKECNPMTTCHECGKNICDNCRVTGYDPISGEDHALCEDCYYAENYHDEDPFGDDYEEEQWED